MRHLRARMLCTGAAVLVVGLAGCGAETADKTAPAVSASAPAAGQVPGGASEDELAASPQGQAFVAAFHQQFPQFADRLDKHIGRYGARICLSDLAEGREVTLRRIPLRFEQVDGKPDAVQSEAILALAIQHLCPEKATTA